MKNKKKILFAVVFLLIVVAIIGAIFSWHESCENFWTISVGELLTIFIAIFIAYVASTLKDNENKVKSLVERELNQLRDLADNCVLYNLQAIGRPDYEREINMFFTRVDNIIGILEKKAKELDYFEHIRYIINEVKELQDFVSDKIKDFEYLCCSTTLFKKHLNKVSSKALEIIFNFYE